MDIKERLRRIHANSFYGLGVSPEDRDNIIKELEDILKKKRRDSMSEDIELVIKIPEDDYCFIKRTGYNTQSLYNAICEGTPLQKGEWLRMSDLSQYEDDRYQCSRCGNVVHHKCAIDLYTFNRWCGKCGSNNCPDNFKPKGGII